MINAVIFDVDGTLVDTVDMHALAWQRAFSEFGRELEFGDVREQIGKGGDQLMPVFLNEHELNEFGEKLEKRRGEIFKSEYLRAAKAFPKVRELMERIKADGKKVVLASSAPSDELEFYVELLNIGDLLEGETSADDAESSKPEPDIFLAAMGKIGDPPADECVVIGDTPYDAEAAGKGGVDTIGVLSGGFSETSLREAGCIEIYQDPSDILANYERTAIALGRSVQLAAPQPANSD
jgi:HAD superfamily hydrolase (TIGR01549 family)